MSHDSTLAPEDPSAAALFDPVAWEQRVERARARRIEALAARRSGPLATNRRPRQPIAAGEPSFREAAGRTAPRLTAARLLAVFVAGLALGLALTYGGPRSPAPQNVATTPPPSGSSRVTSALTAPIPTEPPRVAAASPRLHPSEQRVVASPVPAFPAALTLSPRLTRGAAPPVTAADPAPTRQPTPAEVPVPPDTRLIVQAPRGLPTPEVDRILERLRAAGIEVSANHRVAVAVDASNLRYFFDRDRPRAEAVAARDAVAGAPLALRDFTHLSPRPRPGTLELWLAGSAGESENAGTSTPPAPKGVDPARLRALVQVARETP